MEYAIPVWVGKTKLVIFGGDDNEEVEIAINRSVIEQVSSQKYIGDVLDSKLSFSLQVDHAIEKVKRAAAKIGNLYDGRRGISVQLGIHLYECLVRPQMECAIPVWVVMSENNFGKLERIQGQVLKKIIGVKCHSSQSAAEVVSGIMPVRIESERCAVANIRES